MERLLVSLLTLGCLALASAHMAFPMRSLNFAQDHFRKINPRIEWDPSNYLVDRSGPHAHCKNVGRTGSVEIKDTTKDGASIGGLVDSMRGDRADADAVVGYIQQILEDWIRVQPYKRQIERASYFGCSVRPGCPSGHVVVFCLFSPGINGGGPVPASTQATEPEKPEPITQFGVAFTKEQYSWASRILGFTWDRSHFLENLSGFETRCAMMDSRNWPFSHARQVAATRGMEIDGFYGYSPNLGSTQDAMGKIMKVWTTEAKKYHQVGCSLIADCYRQRKMYVVVACIMRRS